MSMKILIADSISVVRAGLRQVLRDLDASAEIIEANDFIAAARFANADLDLIVIDIAMPGMDGVTGVRALKARAASTPIVIFSAGDDPKAMVAAIKAGARGYVPKSTPNAILIAALRLTMAGGVYMPAVASLGGPSKPDLSAVGALAKLSRRQREILALVSEGMSNQAIADRLDLTLSTVKAHVTAVLKILAVENRTQAVLLAKRASGGADGDVAVDATDAERGLIARLNRELRGPLNSIIGFADIVSNELYGPVGNPRYVEYARNIGVAGRQLLGMIADAGYDARLAAFEESADEGGIDVANVIQTSANTVMTGAKRAKVSVATMVADGLPRLKANEKSIRQLVQDMLATAIRYTPPDRRVTVAAELDPDRRIAIHVKDIGIGIAQRRRRASDGAARGRDDNHALAHVKALIERYGGSLAIDTSSESGAAIAAVFPPERTVSSLAA